MTRYDKMDPTATTFSSRRGGVVPPPTPAVCGPVTRYEYWRAIGAALGYPDCCVEQFVERFKSRVLPTHHPMFRGTGYVPCPSCLGEAVRVGVNQFVEERIAPRRRVSAPFPGDGTVTEELREMGLMR